MHEERECDKNFYLNLNNGALFRLYDDIETDRSGIGFYSKCLLIIMTMRIKTCASAFLVNWKKVMLLKLSLIT